MYCMPRHSTRYCPALPLLMVSNPLARKSLSIFLANTRRKPLYLSLYHFAPSSGFPHPQGLNITRLRSLFCFGALTSSSTALHTDSTHLGVLYLLLLNVGLIALGFGERSSCFVLHFKRFRCVFFGNSLNIFSNSFATSGFISLIAFKLS